MKADIHNKILAPILWMFRWWRQLVVELRYLRMVLKRPDLTRRQSSYIPLSAIPSFAIPTNITPTPRHDHVSNLHTVFGRIGAFATTQRLAKTVITWSNIRFNLTERILLILIALLFVIFLPLLPYLPVSIPGLLLFAMSSILVLGFRIIFSHTRDIFWRAVSSGAFFISKIFHKVPPSANQPLISLVEQTITSRSSLMILGDPGSGKTATLEYAASLLSKLAFSEFS